MRTSARAFGWIAAASLFVARAASAYPLHQIVPPPNLPLGVDVHSGVGVIDWKAVKASGRVFAIIKASQGDYLADARFAANWADAAAEGVLRSAYHFYDPTSDPDAQANLFLATAGDLTAPGVLPPMLDIECPTSSDPNLADPNCEGIGFPGWVPSDQLTKGILHWLDVVEQRSGRRPFVYSYNAWFYDTNVDRKALSAWPLDISWPATDSFWVPDVWPTALVWQDSTCASVPGIPGANGCVDTDRFVGTLDELTALAAGPSAPAQITGNDAMTFVNWTNDGHVEIFAKKSAGTMVHAYPNALSDTWSMIDELDMPSTCGAAAGFWSHQGFAELYDAAPDGTPQHLWFVAGKGWTKWTHDMTAPPTKLSHFSTLVWQDGHMEVVALGGDGAIWHTHYQQGDAAGWAAWESLGGSFATGASAILWGDGHGELFATDAAGLVWHSWSGSGADFPKGWHAWASIDGMIASRPVPVRWADGHVELFARGKDDHLYHSDWGASLWPPFTILSAATAIQGEPSAIMNGSKQGAAAGPEVFARDAKGAVVHLWVDKGAYTEFVPLEAQASASDPFGWIRADGKAEVFAIDASGALTRTLHDGANGWTPWSVIGGTNLDPCVPPPPSETTSSASSSGSTIQASSSSGGATSGAGGAGDSVPVKGGCSCGVERDASAPYGVVFAFACYGALRRRGARKGRKEGACRAP